MVGPIYQTQNSTTSLITSTGTALAANSARIAFSIQNGSTNPLFVYFGSGANTSTLISYVLPACTAQDDGKGGSLSMESGVVYDGIITVAGTTVRCYAVEIAP